MASSSSVKGQRFISQDSYNQWMVLQKQRLTELVEALECGTQNLEERDAKLRKVAQRSLRDFEEYVEQRNLLSQSDVSYYFAPSWNTSLENSLLWIAGCRPSSFIRLVYGLTVSEFSSNIDDIFELHSPHQPFDVGALSVEQLTMINDLQLNTIKEEERLSTRLAVLQESTADFPISVIAKGLQEVGETNPELEQALAHHETQMASIMKEADILRLITLKTLIAIFTPVQAVDFLVASKKLHLSMHEWGKKRDCTRGWTEQF